MPRSDGPFRVLEKVGESAYKIDLPSDYGGVSATFNVGDLSPYLEDESLRSNFFEEGQNDGKPVQEVQEFQALVSNGQATVHTLLSHENIKQMAANFVGFSTKQCFINCLKWEVETRE